MNEWLQKMQRQFELNFIEDERWHYIVDGLQVTLKLTFGAVILGVLIGFLVAVIRTTHDNADKPNWLIKILNFFCRVYLTVIRGTPVVVQLLIIYFVIMGPMLHCDKITSGIVAFGINSGAYVAEIVRAGIMSVDKGQMEAGRSLGFNYWQTMIYIIAPQAFKNVLPALANEVIVLLKETSVAGYIALQDLTKGGDIIRGRTLAAMPLYVVALIYLVMVMFLENMVNRLERRLRQSDRR